MTIDQTILSAALIFVVSSVAIVVWVMRIQQRQAERHREEAAKQNEATMRAVVDLVVSQQNRRLEENAKPKEDKADTRPAVGVESGGYIIVDLPESKKGMFQDLLRGFEDYARLLGYIVRFSVDNSYPDKMAFKFTLESGGITVSTAKVKSDLREYIRKVERNEPLDDLPVVLPEPEHNLLLTALKNRISFLQSIATMQKNTIDYFNALFRQLPNQNWGVIPGQNIIFQSGQGNQAPTYHALNSPQAVQGNENRLIGNRLDQSIRIANSFNEREEQVLALGRLWSGLYNTGKAKNDSDADKKQIVVAEECIHKAWDEMKEGEPPEPMRIKRWLETAKNTLGTFALTEEVAEAAKKVWELFNLGS